MKVYFAGPLFTWGEREQNKQIVTALRKLGYAVFLPQETEQRDMSARSVFNSDVTGMDWADVIVACIDGPDPDSGTSFELGYMFAKGKRSVLFRSDFRSACAEGLGCMVNLMLAVPAERQVPCANLTPNNIADMIHAALLVLASWTVNPEHCGRLGGNCQCTSTAECAMLL